MNKTSAAYILSRTTAFISSVLSQPDIFRRLFSILRRNPAQSITTTTLKPLKLAAEALENAISAANSLSVQSSSLSIAERLLLSTPQTPLSSFLLSLLHFLRDRPTDASLTLLQIFYLDPSLARTDISPRLFEELFLIHLLPVLQWFNEERARILSSSWGYESDEKSSCDLSSVIVPCDKLLSRMSEDQASKLKELERSYEEAVDENCRVVALYFKEVLEKKYNGGGDFTNPPSLVLKNIDKLECSGKDDKKVKTEEIGLQKGRYNPIWAEADWSVEFSSRSSSSSTTCKSKSPFYPQKVSFTTLDTSRHSPPTSPDLNSDSDTGSSSGNLSSSESTPNIEEKKTKTALFIELQSGNKGQQPVSAEPNRLSDQVMADSDNNPSSNGKHTPPKDFVCPITSHLFDDPVTLETGQTYERRAIQEWLDRGNSTCPITRQELHCTQLPKTNYVLKRLTASWQEQNPGLVSQHSRNEPIPVNPKMPATSPVSVISQATVVDGTMTDLRRAIMILCTSEILRDSEMAVLQIERFWQEVDMEFEIQAMLSKPAVINGFVEILFNSVDRRVLKSTVFLLSELASRDNTVIQTLTQVDSDVEGIVALFKKGLIEAVVLIYLLSPSTITLVEMDMVNSLLHVIKKGDDDDDLLKMCLKAKAASVFLLRQILGIGDDRIESSVAKTIVSSQGLESVIGSLETDWKEERIAAVGILLRCIKEDGKCRNIIADKAPLAHVLESFMGANDATRFEIVYFLSELVKLNRRTLNEQVLLIIREEGAFSTMHTLLVYLQNAHHDQCPLIAGLLLQLDLLTEPRKMSIYREEAIDTLILCLKDSNFPAAQIATAKILVSLQGRFTSSGESLTRAFLLKRGGLNKTYDSLMRLEQVSNILGESEDTLEEEKAADAWERKMAFVLVSHEFGLLFEALEEGLKSRNTELHSASCVAATWLIQMLDVLPDTGIRGAARVCLLKPLVSIFKSAKDIEDKTISLLALNSFMCDPEGLRDLASYMKEIMKSLREVRKSSSLAFDMLKVLSEEHDSSAELWNHKELVRVDCSENGEVLSIVFFEDKIFSGHSDGTIKVWTGRGSILHFLQEVHEHAKAVTSLAILQSGEKLYSGSLDKTTRVWSIGNDGMHCVQVHDMKDQVHNLVVANSISCFTPQGAGVKVHSWNGQSKLLNQSKHVKCLALVLGKLYCGCHDNSVQEIDLATGTFITIQSGSRKLLGKANPVHALQAYSGIIYAASSSLDGATVKIWNASNYSLIGSLTSTQEVRAMTVSSELIYLGCKAGCVEIWDKKRHNRIETLQTGTMSKVISVALDSNEEVLVIGTSDGRIQAWGLS